MQELQSKRQLSVSLKDTPLTLISGITFAQVPYWFPFFDYKDLKLDLIRPFQKTEGEKRPLLLWICGGAWITMERSAHLPWLMHFARHGYVVASAEYRLSNSAHFPAQLEDVKKAVRYLKAHACEFGINPDRVVIGGESAGAHLAAMTGVTNGLKKYDKGEYLEQSSSVQAVIDYYGPASFTLPASEAPRTDSPETPDFLKGPSPVDMLLGFNPSEEPRKADVAGPLSYIKADTPPFFIAHGIDDPIVSIAGSNALYDALTQHNIPAEFYAVRNAGHADPRFYQSEMADRILDFLDRVLVPVSTCNQD